MSQIHLQTRQPKPSKILVESIPVKKGRKLETIQVRCLVCSSLAMPHMYNTYSGVPLVMKCINCGRKSWANSSYGMPQTNIYAQVCVCK